MNPVQQINDELRLAAINLDKLGTSKKPNLEATAMKSKQVTQINQNLPSVIADPIPAEEPASKQSPSPITDPL